MLHGFVIAYVLGMVVTIAIACVGGAANPALLPNGRREWCIFVVGLTLLWPVSFVIGASIAMKNRS